MYPFGLAPGLPRKSSRAAAATAFAFDYVGAAVVSERRPGAGGLVFGSGHMNDLNHLLDRKLDEQHETIF